MSGYYVDLSEHNNPDVDWLKYKEWSSQFDGVSRVALRSSYGTGYTDKNYLNYRAGAEKAGIDQIIHYHYSYPQFNAPEKEADWQKSVVGTVRPNDLCMLDAEEQVAQATWQWYLQWLEEQEKNYTHVLGTSYKPVIYANQSYIQSRLQALGLIRYSLILAKWNNATMPASPMPWPSYSAIQLMDNEQNIPGIPGKVDLDLWLA